MAISSEYLKSVIVTAGCHLLSLLDNMKPSYSFLLKQFSYHNRVRLQKGMPCNTPNVILKELVSPSGVNTLACVFSWSIDNADIIDCGIP